MLSLEEDISSLLAQFFMDGNLEKCLEAIMNRIDEQG